MDMESLSHTKMVKLNSSLSSPAPTKPNPEATRTGEDIWYFYGPDKKKRKKYLFCENCQFKTPDRFSLERHIEREHPLPAATTTPTLVQQVSDGPKKSSDTKASFTVSQLIKTEDRYMTGSFRCTICCFRTKHSSCLRKHMIHHTKKFSFQCPFCSYSVNKNRNLGFHINIHHLEPNKNDSKAKLSVKQQVMPIGKKAQRHGILPSFKTSMTNFPQRKLERMPFTSSCPHCNFTTHSKRDALRHETLHQKKSAFACHLCSYLVSSSQHLNAHLKRNHSDRDSAIVQQIYPETPEPMELDIKEETSSVKDTSMIPDYHACLECNYVASSSALLGRHEVYHQRRSVYQCPHCSFSVSTIRYLKKHLNENHYAEKKTIEQKNAVQSFDEVEADTETPSESSREEQEEWYYDPKRPNTRRRYSFCGDCGRKYINRTDLAAHVAREHPNSLTALPPRKVRKMTGLVNTRRFIATSGSHKQVCQHCDFRATKRAAVLRHKSLHLNQSAFQCHHCNYSVNSKANLVFHTKYHHLSLKKKLTHDQELVPDSTIKREVDPKEPILMKCSECQYSTDSSTCWTFHVVGHQRNQKFKCDRCSYSSQHKHNVEVHMKQWHLPEEAVTEAAKSPTEASQEKVKTNKLEDLKEEVSAARERTKLKTTRKKLMSNKGVKKRKRPVIKCPECDFAGRLDNYNSHILRHKLNAKFKCHLCSYSSEKSRGIKLHLKDHHVTQSTTANFRAEEKNAELEGRESETTEEESVFSSNSSATDKRLSNGSTDSITNSRVELQDESFFDGQPTSFSSLAGSVESEEITKGQMEIEIVLESIHFDRRSLRKLRERMKQNVESREDLHDRIQLLLTKVEGMKDKVRNAEEELREVSSRKEIIGKKIKETNSKKIHAEFNLRTLQCEALKQTLTSMESQLEEPDQHDSTENEVKIQQLEKEVHQNGNQLQALREAEKRLVEEVEDAKATLIGAQQVLETLKSEIEALQSEVKAFLEEDLEGQLNQLIAATQEKILSYFNQHNHLLKNRFLRRKEQAKQKQKCWENLVQSQFENEDDEDFKLNGDNSDCCTQMLALLPT